MQSNIVTQEGQQTAIKKGVYDKFTIEPEKQVKLGPVTPQPTESRTGVGSMSACSSQGIESTKSGACSSSKRSLPPFSSQSSFTDTSAALDMPHPPLSLKPAVVGMDPLLNLFMEVPVGPGKRYMSPRVGNRATNSCNGPEGYIQQPNPVKQSIPFGAFTIKGKSIDSVVGEAAQTRGSISQMKGKGKAPMKPIQTQGGYDECNTLDCCSSELKQQSHCEINLWKAGHSKRGTTSTRIPTSAQTDPAKPAAPPSYGTVCSPMGAISSDSPFVSDDTINALSSHAAHLKLSSTADPDDGFPPDEPLDQTLNSDSLPSLPTTYTAPPTTEPVHVPFIAPLFPSDATNHPKLVRSPAAQLDHPSGASKVDLSFLSKYLNGAEHIGDTPQGCDADVTQLSAAFEAAVENVLVQYAASIASPSTSDAQESVSSKASTLSNTDPWHVVQYLHPSQSDEYYYNLCTKLKVRTTTVARSVSNGSTLKEQFFKPLQAPPQQTRHADAGCGAALRVPPGGAPEREPGDAPLNDIYYRLQTLKSKLENNRIDANLGTDALSGHNRPPTTTQPQAALLAANRQPLHQQASYPASEMHQTSAAVPNGNRSHSFKRQKLDESGADGAGQACGQGSPRGEGGDIEQVRDQIRSRLLNLRSMVHNMQARGQEQDDNMWNNSGKLRARVIAEVDAAEVAQGRARRDALVQQQLHTATSELPQGAVQHARQVANSTATRSRNDQQGRRGQVASLYPRVARAPRGKKGANAGGPTTPRGGVDRQFTAGLLRSLGLPGHPQRQQRPKPRAYMPHPADPQPRQYAPRGHGSPDIVTRDVSPAPVNVLHTVNNPPPPSTTSKLFVDYLEEFDRDFQQMAYERGYNRDFTPPAQNGVRMSDWHGGTQHMTYRAAGGSGDRGGQYAANNPLYGDLGTARGGAAVGIRSPEFSVAASEMPRHTSRAGYAPPPVVAQQQAATVYARGGFEQAPAQQRGSAVNPVVANSYPRPSSAIPGINPGQLQLRPSFAADLATRHVDDVARGSGGGYTTHTEKQDSRGHTGKRGPAGGQGRFGRFQQKLFQITRPSQRVHNMTMSPQQ